MKVLLKMHIFSILEIYLQLLHTFTLKNVLFFDVSLHAPFLLKLQTSYNTQITIAFRHLHTFLNLTFTSVVILSLSKILPFDSFPLFLFQFQPNRFVLHHISHSAASYRWTLHIPLVLREIDLSQVELTQLQWAQPHNGEWRMQQASYLSPILYLMDGELHRNVEAV